MKRFAFTLAEGATHVIMSDNICRAAFTLAEVLITLGIIGVVAVLTIPTLVANYQAKQYETAASVFEKKMNEGLRIMNSQQVLAGNKTTERFSEELSKSMNITKICNNNSLEDCFPETITQNVMNFDTMRVDAELTTKTPDLKLSANMGHEDWNTNVVGLMFNNGSSALALYNPECKEDPYNNNFNGTDCVVMLYDTNGFSQPNEIGKDVRKYGFAKIGDIAFRLNGRNFTETFTPTSVTYAECNEMKNSGEYGNVGCWAGTDYWAGAVKQCGSISNLPTIADLQKLAQIIYKGINIEINGRGQVVSPCPDGENCRDTNNLELVMQTLGITDNEFYLWSNVQDSTPRAVFRGYETDNTFQMNNKDSATKSWGYIRTMCAE